MAGAGVFRPSSALNTEIAGVMAPSPNRSAAPSMPMAMIAGLRPCLTPSSDISAMPPSPSLSARIITATYLIEVMISSVQTMSDSMPSASSGAIAPPAQSMAVLIV